jgi:hypothetical protein
MNLIKLSSLKKARIILWINSLILFLFIIFTPHLVKVGVWGLSESTVEGLFLAVEVLVLIKLFRNYDLHSKYIESKVEELTVELEQQQKILTDSLEYLGRMNLQMSMVKKIMNKLKFPASQNKLDYVLNEMLHILISLSGGQEVVFKIINLEDKKTIKELSAVKDNVLQNRIKKIKNEYLLKKDKKNSNLKKMTIFPSSYDNFSLKAFAFFPLSEEEMNDKIEKEQKELIQGVINQCEIIYLLFNSQYYKK